MLVVWDGYLSGCVGGILGDGSEVCEDSGGREWGDDDGVCSGVSRDGINTEEGIVVVVRVEVIEMVVW